MTNDHKSEFDIVFWIRQK